MSSAPSPASSSAGRRSRHAWIRNPLWDGAFMLSALWLAPLLVLFGVDSVYLVVTAVFWIGHRLSSSYLAYCTREYRPLLKTQRVRFVWIPLALAVFTFAFLLAPLPFELPREQRVVSLAVIDYVFVTYHFAAQHYGVLALYRLRAAARDTRAKRVDRAFALGVGGALVIAAEAFAGTMFFQREWLGDATVPFVFEARVACTALVAVCGIVAAADRASLPRALYIANVCALVLCALWASPVVFIVLWTTQHWTAAVGLATITVERKRPIYVLLALVVVSVALWPLMDVEASGDAGRWRDLASSPVTSVLVAIAFVSAFVHYQLDRAVFRFSDPEVRDAARALASPRQPQRPSR